MLASEQPLIERRRQAIDDAEDPDERAHTVMNSGTVTKNPAMKLRRSHCMSCRALSQRQHRASNADAGDDAIPGERRETRRASRSQERLDDDRRARRTPSRSRSRSRAPRSAAELVPHLEQICARRPPPSSAWRGRTRTRRPLRRSSPISMPPTIVAPDRDTPGTSASVWHNPMPSACRSGRIGHRSACAARAESLDDQHHDAAER